MTAALDAACHGLACFESGTLAAFVVAADLGIALGLFAILVGMIELLRRKIDRLHQPRMVILLAFGWLLLLGVLHVVEALGPGPSFGIAVAVVKAAAAVAGLLTAWQLWHAVTRGEAARPAPSPPERAVSFGDLGQTITVQELETARRELESRVEERTKELSLVKARLETALRGAYVHAFSQDRDLRYTWVYDPEGPDGAEEMIGHTDEEILPADMRDAVLAVKRNVLKTGLPESCEVTAVNARGRALYSLHIEPALGADGRVEGLTGAAIDISRVRSLESEQRRLADELRTALRHYEIALRGSHVTLFTQDSDLRFTSVSNPLFGKEATDVVGHTDADILPAASREQFSALARAALATGRPQSGEVSIKEADKVHCYELHVEPLPDEHGEIAGVTSALFDITERKTHESHLRLLMRELTHRSKNLLAVIQSMARQTARHAGSIDDFLDSFGDRLQAIATSHDLLVQEGWYGASLHDLTHRQLAKYLGGDANRVTLSGPAIHLKPAAAQSFGLALHELAMNAERFGALSIPQGWVEINWRRLQTAACNADDGIEIVWAEHGGPDVTKPTSKGFGTLVVEKNLSRALDAEVALSFEPSGVRCRMLIPSSHVLAAR
ncbi:MAG: HWE histidine kinase domain-containing protein [Xanthobacteraceae bacterium]